MRAHLCGDQALLSADTGAPGRIKSKETDNTGHSISETWIGKREDDSITSIDQLTC